MSYIGFSKLLRRSVKNIDASQRENSPARKKFKEDMCELFDDPDMFGGERDRASSTKAKR